MQFLRLPQVLQIIPVGKTTWYRWVEQGDRTEAHTGREHSHVASLGTGKHI